MSFQSTDQELLQAGAALGDLSAEEISKLSSLAEQQGQKQGLEQGQKQGQKQGLSELDELSHFVAELELLYTEEGEQPPASLDEKLFADMESFVSQPSSTQQLASGATSHSPSKHLSTTQAGKVYQTEENPSFARWWQRPELGWAAAACLAIAWYGSLRLIENQSQDNPGLGSINYAGKTEQERQRAQYLELQEEADALAANFQSFEGYEGVQGEVLWHQKTQQGFLLLTGLPPNNAQESQYQLWIADGRDGAPVDGGVFDFVQTGQSDSILIPIDAKLQVDTPVAFVITEEKPGGVVVSAQDRVVALAEANISS